MNDEDYKKEIEEAKTIAYRIAATQAAATACSGKSHAYADDVIQMADKLRHYIETGEK